MRPLDEAVERLGRRLASRTSRRTFLERAGRVAMLVASGPALASLLTQRAEARVCGQSGVAPKCPTFSCDFPESVWGWCWYASPGCCAGGGLKKICDCCTLHYPFVHGYCPSGYNVRCIVESCWSDPRVMAATVRHAPGMTAPSVALAASRLLPPGRGGSVVVAGSDDPRTGAVAAPVAAVAGGPLLLTSSQRLASGVVAEIQRLGTTHAVLVGAFAPTVADELRSYGVSVQPLGATATSPEALSVEVGRWLLPQASRNEAVCIADGLSATLAGAVGAFGAANRIPVVLGVDAAKELAAGSTWLVGPEPAARSGEVTGAQVVVGATRDELARNLATITVEQYGAEGVTVLCAPDGAPDVSVGVAGTGGVLLLHPDGVLGVANYRWLHGHQPVLAAGVAAGSLGALGNAGTYDLQSALNRYDTHRLIGVPGQGLPVISQPRAERDLGKARVSGPAPDPDPPYWSSRARPR